MASKNAIRKFDAQAYYHVYNRGAAGQAVFRDATDKRYFMNLLRRHIDQEFDVRDKHGIPYEKHDAKLVAYCLMGNHFHLLLYQGDDVEAISKLMKAVMVAYSFYFNHKYKGSGAVFQGRYKASLIDDEAYLLHITRYIHINPRTYRTYYWSSLREYIDERKTEWLSYDLVLDMSATQYLAFLENWQDRKAELKHINENVLNW
jgi:REP element-mobilizing transposase RayT